MSKDLEADILRAVEQAHDFTECKKGISKKFNQNEIIIIDILKEIARYLEIQREIIMNFNLFKIKKDEFIKILEAYNNLIKELEQEEDS